MAVNKSQNAAIAAMQKLMDLLKDLFGWGSKPYGQNQPLQEAITNTVESARELQGELMDQGKYAESYLVAREGNIIQAIHEVSATGQPMPDGSFKPWTKQTSEFNRIVMARTEQLNTELDNSELGQVAKRDHLMTLNEETIRDTYNSVTEDINNRVLSHLDRRSEAAFKELRAENLNNLIDECQQTPPTPAQHDADLDADGNSVNMHQDPEFGFDQDHPHEHDNGLDADGEMDRRGPFMPGPGR